MAYTVKTLWLSLACIMCAWPAGAQDAPPSSTEERVFAPYPSRMRVGVKENGIFISWEDSPDVRGGYLIYRHSDEPKLDNFASAVLIGDVPDGQRYFEYLPPDDSPYYYIVLGRGPDETGQGEPYQVFIPLRNISLVPIAYIALDGSGNQAGAATATTPVAALETPSTPAETTPAVPAAGTATRTAATVSLAQTEPDQKPAVDGLIARTDGEAIVVSFDAEESAGRIVLYRSTQAITSSNDMLNAAVAAILEPKAGPYRDYPVPGIAYYYAAFPERELMGGTLRVQAGRNATTVSAVVAAGTYRIGLASSSPLSRAMPLPFLVIQKRMSEARPVIADDLTPQSRSLSAETEKAIALLQARYGTGASVTKPEIMLFPEDMASPGGGEEYALRLVVRNVLSKGRYEQAAEELALYLSLPRSPVNAAKARFYRAQALGFAGRFREAFFELLRAQDAFFLECVPWMDYVLWNLHADGA